MRIDYDWSSGPNSGNANRCVYITPYARGQRIDTGLVDYRLKRGLISRPPPVVHIKRGNKVYEVQTNVIPNNRVYGIQPVAESGVAVMNGFLGPTGRTGGVGGGGEGGGGPTGGPAGGGGGPMPGEDPGFSTDVTLNIDEALPAQVVEQPPVIDQTVDNVLRITDEILQAQEVEEAAELAFVGPLLLPPIEQTPSNSSSPEPQSPTTSEAPSATTNTIPTESRRSSNASTATTSTKSSTTSGGSGVTPKGWSRRSSSGSSSGGSSGGIRGASSAPSSLALTKFSSNQTTQPRSTGRPVPTPSNQQASLALTKFSSNQTTQPRRGGRPAPTPSNQPTQQSRSTSIPLIHRDPFSGVSGDNSMTDRSQLRGDFIPTNTQRRLSAPPAYSEAVQDTVEQVTNTAQTLNQTVADTPPPVTTRPGVAEILGGTVQAGADLGTATLNVATKVVQLIGSYIPTRQSSVTVSTAESEPSTAKVQSEIVAQAMKAPPVLSPQENTSPTYETTASEQARRNWRSWSPPPLETYYSTTRPTVEEPADETFSVEVVEERITRAIEYATLPPRRLSITNSSGGVLSIPLRRELTESDIKQIAWYAEHDAKVIVHDEEVSGVAFKTPANPPLKTPIVTNGPAARRPSFEDVDPTTVAKTIVRSSSVEYPSKKQRLDRARQLAIESGIKDDIVKSQPDATGTRISTPTGSELALKTSPLKRVSTEDLVAERLKTVRLMTNRRRNSTGNMRSPTALKTAMSVDETTAIRKVSPGGPMSSSPTEQAEAVAVAGAAIILRNDNRRSSIESIVDEIIESGEVENTPLNRRVAAIAAGPPIEPVQPRRSARTPKPRKIEEPSSSTPRKPRATKAKPAVKASPKPKKNTPRLSVKTRKQPKVDYKEQSSGESL